MQNKVQDQMKELTIRLEQGIKDVYESERYKNYLSVMSRFYNYSFRNSILIMLQKPSASHIAGFTAWKNNFKRFVNKGEKGIQILAPAPYRIKVEMEKLDPITLKPLLDSTGKVLVEEVEITKPAFRPVYVFDVSQTSGEPLPEITKELVGSVSQYDLFFESLKSVSPFPIEMENIKGRTKGYCDPVNNKIAIKTGMSEVQTIKTAVHEITHADLHAPELSLSMRERTDRKTKEVEAESVAFIVCDHYGIDTSDYSFAYVATWSSDKELNELKSSLDTIQKQAAGLIDRIDNRFKELMNERPVLRVVDQLDTDKDMGIQQDASAVDLYDKVDVIISEERTFTIYQLTKAEENRYRRFESFDSLVKQGEVPDINNYKNVYSGKIKSSVTLENIYQEFNINRPSDFKGHSLSMSDIVVIADNGTFTANYVDTFGFVGCPDFAIAHEQQLKSEILDSIKFDNDIDQDKEKRRDQLGFKDDKSPSLKKTMAEAKKTSMSRSEASKEKILENDKEKPKKTAKKQKEIG